MTSNIENRLQFNVVVFNLNFSTANYSSLDKQTKNVSVDVLIGIDIIAKNYFEIYFLSSNTDEIKQNCINWFFYNYNFTIEISLCVFLMLPEKITN